jgi:hypothetical protein
MLDIRRFQKNSLLPSRQSLEKTCATINYNLKEMKTTVIRISGSEELLPTAGKYQLLYLGSCLYDYYLLVEDCLLQIARTTDKWVPASLDWRSRLIRLMQSPVTERRPPVLSAATATLLDDYLILFLNFHHQCSTLSYPRIKKMIDNLDLLNNQLEKEFTVITKLLSP